MTKLEDLPKELLSRIIGVLPSIDRPYSESKKSRSLLNLCRVSKRFRDLARLEIYSSAYFEHISALRNYFYKSGLLKSPPGTLRKISIYPSERSSFWTLGGTPEMTKHVAIFCSGVEHLEIYTFHDDRNLKDTNVNHYIPLFKAINPKSIKFSAGFSPTDLEMCGYKSPRLNFSTLAEILTLYARLTKLELPGLVFDRVGKDELDILARLPIEKLSLEWPSSLSVEKVYDILVALPDLKSKGFDISYRGTFLEEDEELYGGDGRSLVVIDFEQKNPGVTSAAIQAYLKENGREDLFEKILWQGGFDDDDEKDDHNNIGDQIIAGVDDEHENSE